MDVKLAVSRSTFLTSLVACTLLSSVAGAACGGGGGESFVPASKGPDDEATSGAGHDAGGVIEPVDHGCDDVEVDGDAVVEHEQDFTARFRAGEPYEKTVMLFGGASVEGDNALGNAYIIGLDKADAQMLAEKYPDFYLCKSEGGMEASRFILTYNLVPASCEVYDQIVAALRQYEKNYAIGADRTSLRFEAAPLQLESVTDDASGVDVTGQVKEADFHLVTQVEQLTGQSVIEFGTSK